VLYLERLLVHVLIVTSSKNFPWTMIVTGKQLRRVSQHSSKLVGGKWKSVRVTEVATGLHELRSMRTQPQTGPVTMREAWALCEQIAVPMQGNCLTGHLVAASLDTVRSATISLQMPLSSQTNHRLLIRRQRKIAKSEY
jgi:hypothetical protein